MFGLAPSAAADRMLGHEAGISTRTVDWFLTRFASLRTGQASPATRALARELCGDGILLVDESSMLSTAQLLALTRLCSAVKKGTSSVRVERSMSAASASSSSVVATRVRVVIACGL